jgi:hypothetical protein
MSTVFMACLKQLCLILFKLAGVDLHMSSAYHSQTDGQTKHLNQCLETYLRCFVHTCPTKWIQWLPLAEFWYNSSFHSAFGCSLFVLLMVMSLVTLAFLLNHLILRIWPVNSWFVLSSAWNDNLTILIQSDSFSLVTGYMSSSSLVLSCPWATVSVRSQPSASLDHTDCIGSVANKLTLPATSTIHPVFHLTVEGFARYWTCFRITSYYCYWVSSSSPPREASAYPVVSYACFACHLGELQTTTSAVSMCSGTGACRLSRKGDC